MIKVAIVDDEELVCLYLRRLLERSGKVQVVGHGLNGSEAVQLARRTRPDVVLLDVRMPGGDGLSALPRLLALDPPPAVVMLTDFPADGIVERAVNAGAAGVLVKSMPTGDLVALIDVAARGYQVFGTGLAGAAQHASLRQPAPPAAGLTRRESDVMALLAAGLSNRAIADRLILGEATVKGHVSTLMAKLGCESRLQVGLWAARSAPEDVG